MTPISEALKKEHSNKIEFLQNELKSLGIAESHLKHIHNDSDDEKVKKLRVLAESIKEVYYQAYKTAYTQKEP